MGQVTGLGGSVDTVKALVCPGNSGKLLKDFNQAEA